MLTVVMQPHHQFTLTSIDHYTNASDVTTSLRLPLSWASMEVGSMIVFFAGVPGAFVDLAADSAYSLRARSRCSVVVTANPKRSAR